MSHGLRNFGGGGGGGEVLYINVKTGKQGDVCVQGLK